MVWTAADIPDQRGRVAVVTGGNSGLGLETARALARRGAHVVIAARDRERAEHARRSILDERPPGSVELQSLDLGSLASVRSCAQDVVDRHPRLDLLVANAGVMGLPEGGTEDGFERQFGVNHLGHFVLARRLLPALLVAGAARVVSVTSFARLGAWRIDTADPHLRRRYGPWRAYNRSKLANLHFALELQRRLAAAGARTVSLVAHPGLSRTDLQARSVRATAGGPSQRFFHVLAGAVGMPPGRAVLPQLRASTDADARGGELYGPRWGTFGPPVRRPLFAQARDREGARRLWAVSERETGESFDVTDLVRGV